VHEALRQRFGIVFGEEQDVSLARKQSVYYARLYRLIHLYAEGSIRQNTSA
jgi:hypothetical protein